MAQNATSPQNLTISAWTEITFVNPTSNASTHDAVSFFEYEFGSGTLMPGAVVQAYPRHHGQFFCNEPLYPQNAGKITVI